MTFYKLGAYIQYRWKAKGRHGVHSPFVYTLIEQVLNVQRNVPLSKKLENYFGLENLLWVELDEAKQWIDQLQTSSNSNKVLILCSIHDTEAATESWERICANDKVKVSIDLFSPGLLFFKDEFKEKQHFILKR